MIKTSKILLLITMVMVLLMGCESIFYKNMEDVDLDGDVLKATYRARDDGAANTTQFMMNEIYNLVTRYKEAETLKLKIILISKTTKEDFLFGTYEFNDLNKIRSYESKSAYATKAKATKKKFRILFKKSMPKLRKKKY